MHDDLYESIDYISAKYSHEVLDEWKFNRDSFFNTYAILNATEDVITIFNKETGVFYDFRKEANRFEIDFRKTTKKTIMKFGNLELIKKKIL